MVRLLRAGLLALLAGTASALQSLPAPGVPCATVDPSNPGYATCNPNYVAVPNYYNLMKAGNLNLNVLGADTSGTCDFLEDAFEETFTAPTLNTTRWLASELDGQEHCLGLPPAGNTTCTMMMSSMIKLNAALPANAGGGNGAILTLSQTPCVGNACCNAKGTICAKWAGAHLVSAGCIQYGVLEVEAAFNMPANSGAFYFTATYIVNGATDPAWNELDMGFINNIVGQLEYHATVFTASYGMPTGTLMDALNFAGAGIGPSLNVNNSVSKINGVATPRVLFNTSFASTFHTYKLVWTPTSVAWLVDTVLYRNISYAPWRPMGIRQILRTNKGVNAVGPQFSDSNVYLRRIRYTPYSATAVADAYRCPSMFACYGAMPTGPVGTASMVISVGIQPGAAASGRRLLQQTSADAQSALSTAVSASIPGPASKSGVTTTPAAYSIAFTVTVSNLCSSPGAGDGLENFQDNGVQYAIIDGLDSDLIPPSDFIYLEKVSADGTGCGVIVSLLISGYNATTQQTDYNVLLGRGALSATAASVNSAVGAITAVYLTDDGTDTSLNPNFVPTVVTPPPSPQVILDNPAKCPNYPTSWDTATCKDANGNPWTVWCSTCVLLALDSVLPVITYQVSVQVAASSIGAVETVLNAALLSNGLSGTAAVAATPAGRRLLQNGGSFNVSAPNSLLATRVAAAQAAAATCTSAAAPRAAAVVLAAFVALLAALL